MDESFSLIATQIVPEFVFIIFLVFFKLHRLSEENIDVQSRNLFLQNCLNNSVIPKGLLPSFSSAVAKPDGNLNCKLELIDQNNSFNKMIVIISHYQNLLVNMDEEIEKVRGQLSDISSTNTLLVSNGMNTNLKHFAQTYYELFD